MAALVPVAIFAVGLRTRITPPRALRELAIGLSLILWGVPETHYLKCFILQVR